MYVQVVVGHVSCYMKSYYHVLLQVLANHRYRAIEEFGFVAYQGTQAIAITVCHQKNDPGKFGPAGPARARARARATATARPNVPGPDHYPHRKIGLAGPNLPGDLVQRTKFPAGPKFP